MLDDPKIGTLPDWAYRRWIEFLLLAKEYDHDGLLQPVGDMAWRLRLPVETVSEALRALERVGVARESSDGWLIVNFAKRQANVSSTERVKHYRARKEAEEAKRNVPQNETIMKRNVPMDETQLKRNVPNSETFLKRDETYTEEEEESEEEAEQINAGAAGKILPGQRSSYQEWPAIPNAQTAEKVFQQVTGMTTFPGRARDNDIERICALYDRHHEQTPAYLNTYWQAWLQRGYNRVNTGWLDWAVSGQIPRWRGNRNGNGAGPPGIDPAIGTDDPSVVSAYKYLKNNPHGGGREDALERLKSKGFDYDSEQQKLRPISGK